MTSQPESTNPYAVTSQFQPMTAPTSPDFQNAIYQDGRVLILHRLAVLPDRCVKSNEPTQERLKRSLYWHHPLIYLVLLINIIIYAIVATVVRKTAIVYIPLAKKYKRARLRNMLIAWSLVLAGFVCLVLGAAFSSPQNQYMVFLFALCPILILTGALWGLFGCRVVYAKKIDDHFIWLAGVSSEFREQFPNWPYA